MKDSRVQYRQLLFAVLLLPLLASGADRQIGETLTARSMSLRDAGDARGAPFVMADRLEGRAGLIQAVQFELMSRGYDPGEADGYAGKDTRAAVQAFQRDAGLNPDGQVDANLLAQLERRAFIGRPYFSVAAGRSPSLLGNAQLALSRAGYYRGPVDGILNPATRDAIRAFRTQPYEQIYVDGYPRVYDYLSPPAANEVASSPAQLIPLLDTAPGLLAFRQQEYATAIEQASAAVSALNADESTRMGAFFVRGLAHLQLSDNEAAIRDFTSVLRLVPDQAEAYCNRSVAYERAGLLEFARRDYRRALELRPDIGLQADTRVSLQ